MEKQSSLFDASQNDNPKEAKTEPGRILPPLAHLSRPETLSEFIGQAEVFTRFPFLKSGQFPSMIITGPSGSGKTTLARLISKNSSREFFKFNAVLGGVNELKKLIHSALEMKERFHHKAPVIFIDEIHRFNKAQQDALLPYIEEGEFILIGATTESPKVSINKALLSRLHVVNLKSLDSESIEIILKNTLDKFQLSLDSKFLKTIAQYSHGDARMALNILEEANKLQSPSEKEIKALIDENARSYDKDGNRHYDVISAFIKSMRGSNPNAAVLWLAVMLDGGEDPIFIARRMVIFASEDIGNADPFALTLATSALNATEKIGMPEARIILSQAVTYLASTYKSNSAYLAINEALEFVKEHPEIEVPDHLKNYPPPNAEKYLYPHSYPGHFVKQNYTKNSIPHFYRPTSEGREEGLKKRLESLKN